MNKPPTYQIGHDAFGTAYITCLICRLTSYHPDDVLNRYCGNCHRFHEEYTQ